jgi:hypothetical protein
MAAICAEVPLTGEAVLRIEGAKGDFDATRSSSFYGFSEAAFYGLSEAGTRARKILTRT